VETLESRLKRKRAARGEPPGTWWALLARGWWIATLFAAGSLLFAIGALPAYASWVGTKADSITFFIGSLFFTSAGFLQYRESVDAARGERSGSSRKFFVVFPHRIDWWSSGIQLVGTLYFNVSTGNAARTNLTAQVAHQHVWRPDAVGSVCFLVASTLAWLEVGDGRLTWAPGNLSWRITSLNLVGSAAFGVSAIAGYIIPSTGQIRNAALSNLGTFVGALCFLVGSILLLPERTQSLASSP
jgi:hypothetical protein